MGPVQDRLGTWLLGKAGWYGRGLAEVEMGNEGWAAHGQAQPTGRATGRTDSFLASEVGRCGRCCWTMETTQWKTSVFVDAERNLACPNSDVCTGREELGSFQGLFKQL